PVTQCRTEGSTRGLAAVPRLALDVMGCEVLRVLQLTDTALVPISYLVPRKSIQDFHEDLFPDCAGMLPATGAQAWWAGDSQQVGRVSLHPMRRSTESFSSPVIACTQLQAADTSSTDANADRSEGSGCAGMATHPSPLPGHTEKIYSIRFHPVASDLLVSSSYDMMVRIWELKAGREVLCLRGHTDQIFSLAWSPDGKKLATVSKDSRIRLYEPRRSPQPQQEGPGPEGGRGARLVWVCGGDYLLVSGFDSRSERRILLYRAQALPEGPLSVLGLDVAPSTLLPFYDEDTSVVFLTGKGDTRVFLYEVTPAPPYFLECNSFTSNEPHKGFVFLPKTACEVREVEFARALRLGQSTLEPVAFHVPRVKKEYFQDDIYPPTRVRWDTAPSAKYLAQIILVGAQVVGRAFMRALRQEFAASRAAADARGRSERPQSAAASRIIGISLQEAQQILNVSNLNPEEIQKNYDHLFKVNDKSVGGSFYLQSKVVRAKERLDEELRIQAKDEKEKGWKAET
ncbi:coronin-7, partial [Egretta garzetta]|uniref:coronin-7 n=1 Tax=Egretta garzetta TaxID=188379 RepID=UPI00163CDFB1